MPDNRQTARQSPRTLTIVPFPDPVVERLGHRPGSPYVEFVWLGVLGPSTTFAWQRLARQAAAMSSSSVDVVDLALSLGLGEDLGRNAMVSRTLARLVAFDTARRHEDTLAVRLALPDLPARRLSRLSTSARFAHERFAHGAARSVVMDVPVAPHVKMGL
jgi:hypothetical protein